MATLCSKPKPTARLPFQAVPEPPRFMREAHGLCDQYGDVSTASLLEVWIDEAERRAWFLFEASRASESAGR